jgi:hypothetical protein
VSITPTPQGSLGAVIVANLVDKQLLGLDLFAALPEDNEFAFSAKYVPCNPVISTAWMACFRVLCGAAPEYLQGWRS